MWYRKEMSARTTQKNLHKLFELSILIKGVSAFTETLGGVLLFFVTPTSINKVISFFSLDELSDDPGDVVVHSFVRFAHSISIHTTTFAALYLLSHGIVKLILVVFLFQKKMWAYPASIIALIIFIAYQTYQYLLHPSPILIALTIFDVIVIALIYNEYLSVRKHGFKRV